MSIDEAIAKEKEEAKRLRKIIETGYDGEISIESIFCYDTNAIKEAYETFENCAKEHEQRAEWLEELKCYKNDNDFSEYSDRLHKIAFHSGYNKALDDFVNTVKATFPHDNIAICNTDVIAKKLKAGEENE